MKIEYIALEQLKPHTRNARTHSRAQIKQIAESIKAFGFLVPILADESNTVLAGHGRLEAAKLRQMKEVPVLRVEGLSEARKRALMLADNKIAANAGWDRQRLALELPELANVLIEEELDISVAGFAVAEIDQLVVDFEETRSDPADDLGEQQAADHPVSARGDLWLLGPHRLVCGDARDTATLERLMSDGQAAAAFLDPPFNVKVSGIGGRGVNPASRIRDGEWRDVAREIHSIPESFVRRGRANFVRGCSPFRLH